MQMKRFSHVILSGMLLGSLATISTACKKDGSASAQLTLPEPTPAENDYERFKNIPKDIDAQVQWIKQPLDNANNLGVKFDALVQKYNLEPAQLGAMASVAFSGGKVEISADLSLAEDAKADIQAFLGEVKAAGEAVLTIPKRAQVVAGNLGKMTFKIPTMMAKATASLKEQIVAAAGNLELKGKLEGELNALPQFTGELKSLLPKATAEVKAIPGETKDAVVSLKDAFAGKGGFKPSSASSSESTETTDSSSVSDDESVPASDSPAGSDVEVGAEGV